MKTKRLVVAVLMGTVLLGCPSPQVTKEKGVVAPVKRSVFSLQAEVLKVEGDLIQLRLMKPTAPKGEAKLAAALAQGVIETSYLLEGREVLLNQAPVKVARVAGDEAQVRSLSKTPLLFKAGDRVIFPLDKKVLAVKDFEVIVGRNKDAAKFVQEDVESLLVESGQFSIVERAKLGTLLDEIQLGQSGAIDPATAQKAGKFFGAEIILTGTLAASGDQWNINLRLVNTETGLVIAAIHKMGPLHELKAESFRESKNIDGGFESADPLEAGWVLGGVKGSFTGLEGHQRIYLDKKEAANGTNQSLAMAFKLGSQRTPQLQGYAIRAHFRNQIHRDLSGFTGVKFFAKGSNDFKLQLRFYITSKSEKEKEAVSWGWRVGFPVTKEWREIRIPFNSLMPGRGAAKGEKRKVFRAVDMKYVEWIDWLVHEGDVGKGAEGVIWLDEVSFY